MKALQQKTLEQNSEFLNEWNLPSAASNNKSKCCHRSTCLLLIIPMSCNDGKYIKTLICIFLLYNDTSQIFLIILISCNDKKYIKGALMQI